MYYPLPETHKTLEENIARIANAVPVTLYSRVTLNVEIVVLSCQKCNQCLKGHKSLRAPFECVLEVYLSLSLSLSLSFCWSGNVSSSFLSNVSKVISLWDHILRVFSKCLCHCHCLCHCLLVGQVISPYHSHQITQRSLVSGITLWGCFLNVFAIVFVFVIVIVFVIVFLLVKSCLLITLIKCLRGPKSLGLLFEGVLKCMSFFLLPFFGPVMSLHHSNQMSQRSQVSRIAPLECSLMEVHR